MRNVNNNNDDLAFQLGADEAHQIEVEARLCWDERDADLCICSDPTDGHEARCPQA